MMSTGGNTSVHTATDIHNDCCVKKGNGLFEMQLIKDACFSLI